MIDWIALAVALAVFALVLLSVFATDVILAWLNEVPPSLPRWRRKR